MSTLRDFLAGSSTSTDPTPNNQIPTRGPPTNVYADPKPNIILRFLNAKNKYSDAAAAKAWGLLGRASKTPKPLLITPEIPIDRYLPLEIHLQIFSYLPWESLLACSLASRIWEQILWTHGQDLALISGSERHSRPSKRLSCHKVFHRRICELEIHEDGIDTVGFSSVSPWKPVSYSSSSRGLRTRSRRGSSPSYNPSSSDDSSSSSSSGISIDEDERKREMVYIHPQRSFVLNDALLKLDLARIEKKSLYWAYFRNYSKFKNPLDKRYKRGRRTSSEVETPPSLMYSINLLMTTNFAKLDRNTKSTSWTIDEDAGEEAIVTVGMFLEYVARTVRENWELKKGQTKKVAVRVKFIQAGQITFAVYPIQ
ncbi:hypothetical protein TWF281_003114 [Arthrobotrys megalospora]